MNIIIKNMLIAIIFCGFSLPAFALERAELTEKNTFFSPYADITINTYWDNETQDMEPMDLTKVAQQSGVKSFHLAFITDSGVCKPAWGAQSTYSIAQGWGKHLTNKMKQQGIGYIVSFGGASGNDISLACTEAQLIAHYQHVIDTYKPTGLDFDIENGTANVKRLMKALVTTQKNNPDITLSLTLPVMPEGLTYSGREIVNEARFNNLNFSVNIMAMDYGPAYTGDMGLYAIDAATNLFQFLKEIYPNKSDKVLWKMVKVTPMIGVNDVAIEVFTLKNVDTLRQFGIQKQLGGLSMWSVARDKPCNDKWASPTCSGFDSHGTPPGPVQQNQYDFSKRFLLS